MESFYLGKLSIKDIRSFAALSGVRELYPDLDNNFIASLLSAAYSSVYAIKGHNYEDMAGKKGLFTDLERAIQSRHLITIQYKGRAYEKLRPYKLVNSKGIWYLAAVDGEKLKSFSLSKMMLVSTFNETFEHDTEVLSQIEKEDSIWFSTEKVEVVLRVDQQVAGYFQRRKLLPHQVIDKEIAGTGELIISSKISHPMQIIPIIKYWIPHVKVISPGYIGESIEKELRAYLEG